jgi:hypothetical protein
MNLLGAMLWTLLSYPYCPFDWMPMFPGEKCVGWWQKSKIYTQENFIGIVSPPNFEQDRILPKEQAVVDLCKANRDKGDQTWIYTLLSKVHSPNLRIKRALELEGFKVGILRGEDASPREREAYINKVGPTVDVMISHPVLVATGMELFNNSGRKYNFNHLIFYQTGYDLFAMRQAERRGWRIGQEKDCTVTYMYYEQTMQATAMQLMSRKMMAALQLEEGTVSEEGLAAMCGSSDSDQMALLNAISDSIDSADIERKWSKSVGGTGKKKLKKVAAEEDCIVDVDVLDDDRSYVNADEIDFEENDEESEDASEFEAEQAVALDDVPDQLIEESEIDLDEDDLTEMFANLHNKTESDDLDW